MQRIRRRRHFTHRAGLSGQCRADYAVDSLRHACRRAAALCGRRQADRRARSRTLYRPLPGDRCARARLRSASLRISTQQLEGCTAAHPPAPRATASIRMSGPSGFRALSAALIELLAARGVCSSASTRPRSIPRPRRTCPRIRLPAPTCASSKTSCLAHVTPGDYELHRAAHQLRQSRRLAGACGAADSLS